jgi:uncharacterized membrane protein YbhN (UPF0104 family)
LKFKNILNGVGSLLAVGGMTFVLNRLWQQGSVCNLSALSWKIWPQVFLLSLIYGFLNVALSIAWNKILSHFGCASPVNWSIWSYGISQISKYIPGNIFHFASRQLIGSRAGISHAILSKSSIYELALIALTGLIFSALILPLIYSFIPVAAGIVIFVLLVIVVLLLLRRFFSSFMAAAFVFYLAFLVFYGLIFFILVRLVDTQGSVAGDLLLPFIGAAVVAWLAGLVTPGAPAGLGVREAVLLLLLSTLLSQGHLELAVVLGRLVTASGDLFFYLATYVWGRARKMALLRI